LDDGGREAVTLRAVGARAGFSRGAPYKHFPSKEALLAGVAARELRRHRDELEAALRRESTPEAALETALVEHARHAVAYPERYRLIYGRWETATDELVAAAEASSTLLTRTVREAQATGALPAGSAERLSSLLRATTRGAAELDVAGHLEPEYKGGTDAAGLVGDLLRLLDTRASAAEPGDADGPAA
jgi:AcrR family transcriptional regulator